MRRRVCHLHPCLQRWRLRAQTEQLEKQLLAVAAWRNAARRGLRSLCAVARGAALPPPRATRLPRSRLLWHCAGGAAAPTRA